MTGQKKAVVEMTPKSQKGVVIAFTIVVFGLMIVGLTDAISDNARNEEANATGKIAIDRAAYKYENIFDNIIDILNHVAGLRYDANASYIEFSESLPEKGKQDMVDIILDDYIEFIERHNDGLDININTIVIDRTNFNIQPYDINYRHSTVKGRRYNEIIVEPAAINFKGYTVDITLKNQDYNSIQKNVKHTPTGNIDLDIVVLNSSKIVENELHYDDVDPAKTSTITVKTTGQAQNDIVIEVSNLGVLTITNNNSVAVDINVGIDFGSSAMSKPYIALTPGLVEVGLSEFGIEKR